MNQFIPPEINDYRMVGVNVQNVDSAIARLKTCQGSDSDTRRKLLETLSKDKYDSNAKKAAKYNKWVRKHIDSSWPPGPSIPIEQRRITSSDDRRAGAFFALIAKHFGFSSPRNDVNLIVVNHVVPTLPIFLEGLQHIANVALVIPKKSVRDPYIFSHISQKYKVIDLSRETLKKNKSKEYIHELVENGKQCIILDVGGYFAPCLKELAEDPIFFNGLLGVVEDTENGHQKYEQIQKTSPWPIISVARSELKKSEDFNVGKSIIRATDTILRINAHTLTERMRIGVIGFGKIGQSIAVHLQRNYLTKISICDVDPVAQMHAISFSFAILDKDELIRQSDLIFCATGNKSLSGSDFENIKDNVFIASCTSADDEFDLSSLTEESSLSTTHIKVFSSLSGKSINMLAGGNAVNFVYNGVNGPYIYAVQAALMAGCASLINEKDLPNHAISDLSIDKQRAIAEHWIKFFGE